MLFIPVVFIKSDFYLLLSCSSGG